MVPPNARHFWRRVSYIVYTWRGTLLPINVYVNVTTQASNHQLPNHQFKDPGHTVCANHIADKIHRTCTKILTTPSWLLSTNAETRLGGGDTSAFVFTSAAIAPELSSTFVASTAPTKGFKKFWLHSHDRCRSLMLTCKIHRTGKVVSAVMFVFPLAAIASFGSIDQMSMAFTWHVC